MSGKIRIYACGGCGIKVSDYFNNVETEKGFAKISLACLDASDSNIRGTSFTKEQLYIIPGDIDGSGGVRGENIDLIDDNYQNIINEFPPQDINIIVGAGGGGSGSGFVNVFAERLTAEGHSTLVIIVGSSESTRRLTNSISTIKSLALSVEQINKNITMAYFQNEAGGRFYDVDKAVRSLISKVSYLGSRQNIGLDSADLRNFFDYSAVAKNVPPMLVLLQVCDSVEELRNVNKPISIASIYKELDPIKHGVNSDYDCFGTSETPAIKEDMHFAITADGITDILKVMENERKASTDSSKARTNNRITISEESATKVGKSRIILED